MSGKWPEPDRALFSISVAAELSGLHPQTLRGYERQGLLEPARTAGGTRRYSGADVDQLREIGALADEGVNIAGMRRILELTKTIRTLEAKLSGFDDLTHEAKRLGAEVAILRDTDPR